MTLEGKNAVVTGGGTGIGEASANALAAAGARVLIAGRRLDTLLEAIEKSNHSDQFCAHAADVSKNDDVTGLFEFARKELGTIDILVNCAGVNVANRSMAALSLDDWDLMMHANAYSAFYCMRAVLPHMRERRDGVIVNISSVAGKRASRLGGVGYSASKFAMTALGMTAAAEEAPNGIRISNIYPGEVDTPILERRPTPVTPEHRARILKPEDVAAAVLLIASLPPRAHIPELVIKPTPQEYV